MEPAFSYDEMPYSNKFFPQTHPDRLATIGVLFGMSPTPIEKCRVLELGCGNGSNLIYQAVTLSGSEFVGVDLAAGHIDLASKSAKDLGVSNVAFHQMDVTKMTVEEFGKFDYIIAHGLFSWVPDFVRESVLQLYRNMLTENGIGYVSYNAYPGAHYREMAQEMMRYHTRGNAAPMEKVNAALQFVSDLYNDSPDDGIYKLMLQHEVQRHEDDGPEIVFHDDLAEINRAFYFHEFAGLLEKNGLQFLSEEKLSSLSMQKFSPEVRTKINAITDVIEREQYLDFLKGRVFRKTLFCHKEVKLNRDVPASHMDKFFVDSFLQPVSDAIEIDTRKVERFTGLGGVNIQIDHPLTKAVLYLLYTSPQGSKKFGDTLNEARILLEGNGYVSENWNEEFEAVRNIMFQIACETDIVELHLLERPPVSDLPEKPKTHPLPLWQLQYADAVATPLNIGMRVNDPVARHLLYLLDGTRTKADLVPELSRFIEQCGEIKDKAAFLKELPAWLDGGLAQFNKIGMFV